MSIPVVVRLKLPDGREFDVHKTTEPEYVESGSEYFWWTSGNASCDCNKVIFIDDEYNTDLDREDYPCGDTIELLSLKVDGKELL